MLTLTTITTGLPTLAHCYLFLEKSLPARDGVRVARWYSTSVRCASSKGYGGNDPSFPLQLIQTVRS